MIYTFIAERCSDLPVSTCCRVMKVSTSGFYQRRASRSPTENSTRRTANEVHDIWTMSRHSYGSPRSATSCASVAACTARRPRANADAHVRRGRDSLPKRRGTAGDGDINDDLVNRAFDPTARTGCGAWTSPNTRPGPARSTSRSWSTPGRDASSGWSIADHIRAELVADAIQMATWQRQPPRAKSLHTRITGRQHRHGWSATGSATGA